MLCCLRQACRPCMSRMSASCDRSLCVLLQTLVKEGESGLLPAVMEAYARPTRIVRGKNVSAEWGVDEGLFEMEEERALWAAFRAAQDAVGPAMGVRDFFEVGGPQVLMLHNHRILAKGQMAVYTSDVVASDARKMLHIDSRRQTAHLSACLQRLARSDCSSAAQRKAKDLFEREDRKYPCRTCLQRGFIFCPGVAGPC